MSSWYDYFENAANTATETDCPNLSFDGDRYKVDDLTTPIRREAVKALPEMRCAPPTEYSWPRQPDVEGTIDESSFLEGLPRRGGDARQVDAWYEPCAANTTFGIGWRTMEGFEPAKPTPTSANCPMPLLYGRSSAPKM